MKSISVPVFLAILLFGQQTLVRAQFHQKTSDGKQSVRQMNNSFTGGYTGANQFANPAAKGKRINAVVIPSSLKAPENVKIRPDSMDFRNPDFWTRVERHPDGSFTETKRDAETEHDDNLVIQETKSKNGTLLLKRVINLDATGRPSEVMIYDGAGNYKYRGAFVYDNMGRLTDELLYDTKGTPLRRTAQEYDVQGKPLPLKSWDYVKNVPRDLQIVVSQPDALLQEQLAEVEKNLGEIEMAAKEEAKKRGLFDRMRAKKDQSATRGLPGQYAAPPVVPEETEAASNAAPKPKKGFRFFNRNR